MADSQVTIPIRGGLTLTEIRAGDQAAIVEYLNDPEIYANTLRIPSPYKPTDAEKYLAILAENAARLGFPTNFAIRNEQGKLIGGCGFEGVAVGHRAEIGYWVARPFWGQGIASATVRVACEHAIARWKLVRIAGHVFTFNPSSARVLEKNGFEYEGLLRKYAQKMGQTIDCRAYALVR
jgi:RimJ/RimL family protein N-acetyltransferase